MCDDFPVSLSVCVDLPRDQILQNSLLMDKVLRGLDKAFGASAVLSVKELRRLAQTVRQDNRPTTVYNFNGTVVSEGLRRIGVCAYMFSDSSSDVDYGRCCRAWRGTLHFRAQAVYMGAG